VNIKKPFCNAGNLEIFRSTILTRNATNMTSSGMNVIGIVVFNILIHRKMLVKDKLAPEAACGCWWFPLLSGEVFR
jgi:hypothetical protein